MKCVIKIPQFETLFVFRFVFTLADLDTVAPAFDFFVEQLALLSTEKGRAEYQEIDLDFPQYFCYERSQEMIMIKIELSS